MYLDDAPRCRACGGTGSIEPGQESIEPPGEESAEFVRAWVLVEKYGPAGALVMLGEESWDERFAEAVAVFDAELHGLETRDEAAWRKSSSKSS